MRRILYLFFFLFSCALSGQARVSGEVWTASGEPVAYATVAIYRADADSSLLGVGYTDDTGNFSLLVATEERIRVMASFLGYRTVEKQGEVADRFSFRLAAEPTVLTEVKVAARRLSTYSL